MEPHPSSKSVIELVLDVRLEYEVTLGTRRSRSPRPASRTPLDHLVRVQLQEKETKKRPVATVRPATFERKRDPSEENEPFKKDLDILELASTPNQVIEAIDNFSPSSFNKKGEEVPEETEKQQFSESVVFSENDEEKSLDSAATVEAINTFPDNAIYISSRYRSYRLRPFKLPDKQQEFLDPCKKHRDFLLLDKNTSQRRMECEDGHGCSGEPQPVESQQAESQQENLKELPITECLDEFLAGLHLGHLADYFRVLGCTCVRDLRLLETAELEAIQLVSRRRLLQQLDSLKLHHEAPPEDCSLEGWLTWYGLTHISGFLKAIGVHSVHDLTYLRDDDLSLLKPVTRRRILACNKRMK